MPVLAYINYTVQWAWNCLTRRDPKRYFDE
jgi:hypothetical protein